MEPQMWWVRRQMVEHLDPLKLAYPRNMCSRVGGKGRNNLGQ